MTTEAVPQPKRIPTKIVDTVQFRDHQLEGIRWLAKRKTGAILADEPGLGKTLQTLTTAAIHFDAGRASRVLVLCGAKLKPNWVKEIEKWTHFTHTTLEGPPKKRMDIIQGFDTDILVANYEQLPKHIGHFNKMGFDIVLIDESHEICNPATAKGKAILDLEADMFFPISATPMLNRPDELYVPLKLVRRNTTDNPFAFRNRFCLYRTKSTKDPVTGKKKTNRWFVGVQRADELQELCDRYMLRRLKKDCLDLPDKQFIRINVALEPYQLKLYREFVEALKVERGHDGEVEPAEAANGLKKALRLRQICSTPACLKDEETGEFIYEDRSAKLDVAMDKAAQLMANGHKVGMFTQFKGTVRAIVDRANKRGLANYGITGDFNTNVRAEMIDEWTEREDPAILAGTYPTIGVGLTLTAARHVIVVDKLYVPGKMEQAVDRFHRIGADTEQAVQIFELIADGTYEDRVEEILESKEEMVGMVIPNSGWQRKVYEAILSS